MALSLTRCAKEAELAQRIIDHLEAEGTPPWSHVAVAALDEPASTRRPQSAPGAPLRPLAIARRHTSGPTGPTFC